VVAHDANAAGTPELEHGVNALLGPDAGGLADGVLRIAREHVLRARLEEEGRRTYERVFAPPVAAEAILGRLEQLARVPVSVG
jgi:hypothetical protein